MQNPNDAIKTVSQLQAEVGRLRARVAELEASQAKGHQVEEAQRRRAQELDALQATVLDITIPHDLPSLLQTIVERAARLLDAPSGGLYLCDAGQQQVRCVVSYNTPQDYRGTVLQYGEGAAGTVALTAEPLVIDDYGIWEGRALAFEQHQPFRAVLAVPMIWQGVVTGVIDIVRYEEDVVFTEKDLALLSLFANHAAIAVENTRLYEQAQEGIAKRVQLEQQSEERRVYLESMLACTPDAIVTLDAHHRVLEWNPGAERLFGYTLEEVAGHDIDELIAAPDAAILEQAIRFTRQALSGEPVAPTEAVRYHKDGSPIDVIVAGSPIFVQGELVGTVAVYTDITAYKEAQEALRRRVGELDALQATVLDITIPHDLPIVLETIVERAARMLDAPGGGLYLCEPDREQARCVVSLNAPHDLRDTVFRYGEGIVGTVAQTGKPIKVEGQRAATERAPAPGESTPIATMLAVPLIWQGTVTGVIAIDHTLEGQAFSDADLELLTLFANHAAIAVENARLYDLAQAEIAERRRTLRELNSSRQLLQTIYDAIPDAVVSTDPNFRIVSCNAAVERILGYRADELLGQSYTIIMPREMFLDPRQGGRQAELFEKGYLAEEEDYYFKRKSGQAFPGSFSVALIKDEQGRPMGAVGTIRDITERRQAEEEIEQLKEFNEGIVQNMAEGIVVQDGEGCFRFINPAGIDMLGYAPEELIGKHWTSIVPPDQQSIIQAADERRMRGESDRYEVELVRRDGARLPVLISGSPRFHAETGQFAGMLAVFTNISERVQAEQALTRRAREMAALYRTSLEINAQLDLSTLLNAIVQRAAELVGARIGGLYMIEPGGEGLELVVGYNMPAEYIGAKLKLGEGLSGRVSQSGDPVMVADYQAWEGQAGIYGDYPFRRVLGVPLKIGDRVIGVINVTDDEQTGPFDEDQVRLVSLFADQAAIAVENTRLFQETEQRLKELTLLFETSTVISTSLDVDEVLQATSRQISTALAAEGCTISQWDRDQDVLITRLDYASDFNLWSPEPPGTTYDLDDYPATRQVLESRQPCTARVSDPDADPAEVALMRQWGIQSLLMVPLVVRDQAIGLLEIQEARKDREFTSTEISLCQTLANLAAAALENARLFEAEREQRELAEALRRAAAAVSSTLDLDQVLDLILEQVSRVITYDAANVMLIEGDQARIVRSRGYERFGVSDSIQSVTFHIPDTPGLRHVLETGEPLVIPNTAAYQGWIEVPETRWLCSIAMSPIRVQEQVIGFLNVDSATPEFFHAGHTDRLRAFADQASVALTNAQLFQTVEQGKRDWETTFDAMQDAVALVDRADHVVRANRAFANLVGRAPTQVAGQAYHSLLDGAVCPETTCPLEQTLQGGQPAICVHEYQEQVLEVQTTPIFTDGSEQSGFASSVIYVLRDITGRKEAEREIRRRNRDLALLNRVIAASATSLGSELALQTACRELALAFDVPHAIAILYSQEKGEPLIAAEYRCGTRASVLGRIIPLVGTPIHQHFQELQSPMVVEDARNDSRTAHLRDLIIQQGIASLLILPLSVEGEVLGAIVLPPTEPRSFSDDEVSLAWRVAEQVSGALARARLQESQQRLSAAVEQAAEAVVITDTDGSIFYANPAFEQLTGYDSTELVGQSPRMFSGANQEQIGHGEMWQVVTAGQPWQGRFAGNSKDGRPFKADLVVTPVRNQTGDIVNFVGTMRDVTREVQLEEQFQQAQRMEALGRLAGGIAHDFNNLLTIIHLSTRLMERQLRPEDPLWDHVQRVQETGERATKLTRQLLSFSRREFAEPQVLDLNQVVCDLSRMLQRIIGEDIDLVTDLADDLWLIEVDPSQMDQVLMNLVLNARDAMPGGGTLTIRTANVRLDEAYAAAHVDAQAGRHVLLTISDTGMGIDDEAKAHLFEPFFTTKQLGQGTGLGLSTVFGIVTQNGGHIRVESKPGQGATFQILLPSTEDHGAEMLLSAPSSHSPKLTAGTETILVAEDEEEVRNLAVSVLRTCGYHVLAAEDGPEAIQISERHPQPIDLLIADVVMPQLGGRELAECLQRQRPALRVMYMSGYVDRDLTHYSASTPGTIFMAKPFTIEDLTQKVRTLLDEQD